jgi:hypothetical protein
VGLDRRLHALVLTPAAWPCGLGLNSDLDDQQEQTAQAQRGPTRRREVDRLSGQIDDISQSRRLRSDLSPAGALGTMQEALDGLKGKLVADPRRDRAGRRGGRLRRTLAPRGCGLVIATRLRLSRSRGTNSQAGSPLRLVALAALPSPPAIDESSGLGDAVPARTT